MMFSSAISAAVIGFASLASAITVSYDTGYDDKNRALTAVSCSDGANGLITKYRWQNQGQVAGYPYIGGYQGIAGWNSNQCGTCYGITYNGKTIYVLAIDHTASGFNLAQGAMDALTNNQAVALGRVDAAYVQVENSKCGL